MSNDSPTPEKPKLIADELVTTEHEIVIGGQTVRYRATTGLVSLNREKSEDDVYQGVGTVARLFVTAYTRLGVDDVAARPITSPTTAGRAPRRYGCTWERSALAGW